MRSRALAAECLEQLLSDVRSQRTEHLRKRRQRRQQRVHVRRAERTATRDHPLLVVLDAVEQAHDIAHRAVRLDRHHVRRRPLDRRIAPLLKARSQVLGFIAPLELLI